VEIPKASQSTGRNNGGTGGDGVATGRGATLGGVDLAFWFLRLSALI
jgi:hypothetical protein